MTTRQFPIAALVAAIGVWPSASLHAQAPQDALITLLAPPMMAVTRLLVDEQWNERLDEVVRRAPAVIALGSKWPASPEISAKAGAVIQARITKIADLYATTDELTKALRSNLDRLYPGDDLKALQATLAGPMGPAAIRYEARSVFIVEGMPPGRGQPEIGSREWVTLMGAFVKKFNERIGPEVPAVDLEKDPGLIEFVKTKTGKNFMQLWSVVVSKAATQITGAINLVLFDDRPAINRDIARIVATIK